MKPNGSARLRLGWSGREPLCKHRSLKLLIYIFHLLRLSSSGLRPEAQRSAFNMDEKGFEHLPGFLYTPESLLPVCVSPS